MDEWLTQTPFRPPAPTPRRTPLSLFAFLKAARDNPLTTWMIDHFEQPIVTGEGALGNASTARLALLAAVAAVAATGLMHLLLVSTPARSGSSPGSCRC